MENPVESGDAETDGELELVDVAFGETETIALRVTLSHADVLGVGNPVESGESE